MNAFSVANLTFLDGDNIGIEWIVVMISPMTFPQHAHVDLIKKKCHTKSQKTTISLILPPLFNFRVSIYPRISST